MIKDYHTVAFDVGVALSYEAEVFYMSGDVYILRHSKYFSPTLAPVTATGAYSAPASLLHYFFS